MEKKLARTPEEIRARIDQIEPEDFLGWSRELLIDYLPFRLASEFLKDGVTEEEWEEARRTDPKADLIDYLDFAWEKALNERGISANRSVDKIREWLWLMGDDELLGRFLSTPYPEYGKPQLRVVTEALAPEKMPDSDVVEA